MLLIGHYLLHTYKVNLPKWMQLIHSAIERLSLAIPLNQFTTYIVFSHYSHEISIVDEKYFAEKIKLIILAVSATLSNIVISIIPHTIKSILTWKTNHTFAIKSGLLFHFRNIDALRNSTSFYKAIENLGEVKTIKILGVTGYNTFASSSSYLHEIFSKTHLNRSNNPEIKILLSKKDSEGLLLRSSHIGEKIEKLNREIENTKLFLDKSSLKDIIEIAKYSFEPKFKLIIIEGKNKKLAFMQAYLNGYDIKEEQIYIYHETSGTSMYKMIDSMYDEIYIQIMKMSASK